MKRLDLLKQMSFGYQLAEDELTGPDQVLAGLSLLGIVRDLPHREDIVHVLR